MPFTRRIVVPAAWYSAGAAIFTWPLALHPLSRLGALQGPGDPFFYVWVLGWDLRTITAHPSWLLTGRIFDANIFWPAEGALAYSDHLILQALALWPVYAISGNPVLCYNVLLVTSLVASALAMHAFVRTVTGSERAAYVAGLVWGFCPFHALHLTHIQLQALYWLPLSFLFLHRVVAARRWRDVLALGVVTGLQAVSSLYYAVIGGFGLVVGALTLAAAVGRWRDRRLYVRLVAAGVLAAAIAAPTVWPYWRAQQREGFARNLFAAGRGSAVVASYLQAPPANLLYGRTGWLRPPPGGGGPLGRRDGPEQDLWPGVTVLILAGVGLWGARRAEAVPLAWTAVTVALTGFVLSLGPDGARWLYSALYDWIFGLHAVRAPARFAVLPLFALAVLAGLGAKVIGDRWRRPAAVTALAVGLLAVEFANGALPLAAAPQFHTPVGRWLAATPTPGAVLYLPLEVDLDNTPFMVESLEHGRPIVNGYSGQRPSFYLALVDTMRNLPASESLLALREIGVRFIVSNGPLRPLASASPLVERVQLGDRTVYELLWTPESEATLTEASGPPLPEPGPAPFEIGETATYSVQWVGGPLALSAGKVTLQVEPPGPAAAYRFSATAVTADWISRFFEADDRLESDADARMGTLAYRQTLNEGRRHLARTMVFEPARRIVRIVPRGETRGLSLPLTAGARDPLTAFFYARTLPLAPGYRVSLPINDAGRGLTLDLAVTGEETITLDGRPQVAVRVEPRVSARVERRRPLRLTVWISRDTRRIPLVVDVVADFGSVRAELVRYVAR